MGYVIETLTPEYWQQVREIYLQGIATGHSTFEETVPDWEKWDTSHMQEPRPVARADTNILGWIVLSPVSRRLVYSGVAEVSLYARTGSGRGK